MSDIKRPGLLDDPAPRPSARPSLTGSSASPAPAGESVSILSAVAADEPRAAVVKGPVRSGLARALPWIGVAMLGLIGVAFWHEWSSTHQPAVPVTVASTQPKATPAAAVAAAPAVAPTASEPEPQQVAQIESAPEPPPAVAATAPAAAAVMAAPAAAPLAKAKPPKPAPPAKPAVAQRSPFAAMQEPEPAARKIKPPPSTGNRDVDLLAALLSGGAARPPTASNAPRSKFSTKLSSMEPGLSTKPEPTPSTRERLSLCNLGPPRDLSACKAKVCKGLWGQDTACPAASQPPVRKQD